MIKIKFSFRVKFKTKTRMTTSILKKTGSRKERDDKGNKKIMVDKRTERADVQLFDLLIYVCQNRPIDFKLNMMIPNTVRYNIESAATR